MNFLSEVLASADQTDIRNITENLPKVSEKIYKSTEKIRNYLRDVYVQYMDVPKKNLQFLDLTLQLSIEIEELGKRIDQHLVVGINDKLLELDDLVNELERSKMYLNSVTRLVQIHETFMNAKEHRRQQKYLKAATELLQIQENIDSIPKNEAINKFEKVVEALQQEITLERGALGQTVIDTFDENVKLIQDKCGGTQTTSIKIQKNPEELKETIEILSMLGEVGRPLARFDEFLWNGICKPIITKLVPVKTEEKEDFYVLTVVKRTGATKVDYKDIYEKLIEVFTFLNAYFNFRIDDVSNTVSRIGLEIESNLFETIRKECLENVPMSTDDELGSYKRLVEDTEDFQRRLAALQICTDKSRPAPIVDYFATLDLAQINKRCEEFSVVVFGLMKKDLHDMVQVGVPPEMFNPIAGNDFPESAVSRSTIELVDQTESLLRQATKETEAAAERIICTLQSTFYQYGSIVYGHHERLLQTIPQQVVLYRNNCMYLAHNLNRLNENFDKKFDKRYSPIFKDQPHQLRMTGGDIFLGYVEQHITTMEHTLVEYKFVPQRLSENLCLDTDKCLRQCLRQYELLKTVWHKILPHAVYNKTLGYLLNAFCKKLIEVVAEAQDISSKNAEHLVEMYKVVLVRGPKLFTDPHEINLYVQVWHKLNDLIFVLGARLVDIGDRWADGKGSLTLHFSADEVKHLVKALFQNNDRRAAVLARIHN